MAAYPEIILHRSPEATPAAPLDICAICPDMEDDCPLIAVCRNALYLKLELEKQPLERRMSRSRSPRRKMELAMDINKLCDRQCPGTLERIISRTGGEGSV